MALYCPLWILTVIVGTMRGRRSQGEADSMEGRVKREETNKQILDDMLRPLIQTAPEDQLCLASPVI